MKKKGLAQNKPSDDRKRSLPCSSFSSSSWFTFLIFLLILTETNYFSEVLPDPSPLYSSEENNKNGRAGWKTVMLCFSTCFWLPPINLQYDAFCYHLFLMGQEGDWMHGNNCISRNIIEGVKRSCHVFVGLLHRVVIFIFRSLITLQCNSIAKIEIDDKLFSQKKNW